MAVRIGPRPLAISVGIAIPEFVTAEKYASCETLIEAPTASPNSSSERVGRTWERQKRERAQRHHADDQPPEGGLQRAERGVVGDDHDRRADRAPEHAGDQHLAIRTPPPGGNGDDHSAQDGIPASSGSGRPSSSSSRTAFGKSLIPEAGAPMSSFCLASSGQAQPGAGHRARDHRRRDRGRERGAVPARPVVERDRGVAQRRDTSSGRRASVACVNVDCRPVPRATALPTCRSCCSSRDPNCRRGSRPRRRPARAGTGGPEGAVRRGVARGGDDRAALVVQRQRQGQRRRVAVGVAAQGQVDDLHVGRQSRDRRRHAEVVADPRASRAPWTRRSRRRARPAGSARR